MNYTQFQVNQFKLSSMVDHPQIVVVKNRGDGFTHLLRELITTINPTKIYLYVNKSKSLDYIEYLDDYFFGEVVQINSTEELGSVLSERLARINFVSERPLIINDQNTFDHTHDSVWELGMNSRHYKLASVTVCNPSMIITSDIRLNLDYVFISKPPFVQHKKRMYDYYCGMFPSFESFDKVLSKCTDNYSWFVVDNRKTTNNIQDKIFWIKPFDLGTDYSDKNHSKLLESVSNKCSSNSAAYSSNCKCCCVQCTCCTSNAVSDCKCCCTLCVCCSSTKPSIKSSFKFRITLTTTTTNRIQFEILQ
jgi:hypothetical protein